jgi:hypothetical protein
VGVYNGLTEWKDAQTFLQKTVTGGVLIYGVLGVAGVVGLILRKRWTHVVTILWGVVVTYVASVAAIAYAGDDATVVGAVFGGLGAALTAAGVCWAARVATRSRAGGVKETHAGGGYSAPR